jgi:hypothetical protein
VKKAREIGEEHRMSIEYAVRVATGQYSLEFAVRHDRLKKQARPQFSKKTREIAEKHGISIESARKVVRGRYSLEFAKKQQRLKKRQGEGKSVDAFTVGRRLPGSFGSNQ